MKILNKKMHQYKIETPYPFSVAQILPEVYININLQLLTNESSSLEVVAFTLKHLLHALTHAYALISSTTKLIFILVKVS